jgi:hypothetical protein
VERQAYFVDIDAEFRKQGGQSILASEISLLKRVAQRDGGIDANPQAAAINSRAEGRFADKWQTGNLAGDSLVAECRTISRT